MHFKLKVQKLGILDICICFKIKPVKRRQQTCATRQSSDENPMDNLRGMLCPKALNPMKHTKITKVP